MNMKVTIGVDEVGRGPLAGPVCLCAFVLPEKFIGSIRKTGLPLRDSKKLSVIHRELWHTCLKQWKKEGKVDYAISYESAKVIDKIGLSLAIKKALSRSLLKVGATSTSKILLDGALFAPPGYLFQKTIIKGDEKETAISLASIVAKVSRDRLMVRLSKKHPEYFFQYHKGYGTKAHYRALEKYGATDIHRQSFLRGVLTR